MATHLVDMNITNTFNNSCRILLVCLILAACVSRPALTSKSAVVPAGVDFSGQWQLQLGPGASRMPDVGSEPRIRIPPASSRSNSGGPSSDRPSRRSQRSAGTAVRVFLEFGESLKISQTRDGLFISFDRAIVEEYTFGENRVVSVGPIEAHRVSGWQEGVFVVETLDDGGTILTESWRLDADGNVLLRNISIVKGDDEQFSSQERFDRISDPA